MKDFQACLLSCFSFSIEHFCTISFHFQLNTAEVSHNCIRQVELVSNRSELTSLEFVFDMRVYSPCTKTDEVSERNWSTWQCALNFRQDVQSISMVFLLLSINAKAVTSRPSYLILQVRANSIDSTVKVLGSGYSCVSLGLTD